MICVSDVQSYKQRKGSSAFQKPMHFLPRSMRPYVGRANWTRRFCDNYKPRSNRLERKYGCVNSDCVAKKNHTDRRKHISAMS